MKFKAITAIILLLSISSSASTDSCLGRWGDFSHTDDKSRLTEWIRNTAENILAKNKIADELNIALPAHPDCTGMFITLIRKGRVRGCYGAFTHRYNTATDILKDYIKGALYLDPRHTPLEKYELEDTEIILTITTNPEPVEDINNVDISNFGLFIECEDSSRIVIVPAEYKTSSKILKLTGNSGCRFQKFHAVTIR